MAAMRLVMAASILLLAECRSMVRREATPKVQLDEDRAEHLAADPERAAALQAPELEPFAASFVEDGVGGGGEANIVRRGGKGGKGGNRMDKHGKSRSGKRGRAARRGGKHGGKRGKRGSRRGKNGSSRAMRRSTESTMHNSTVTTTTTTGSSGPTAASGGASLTTTTTVSTTPAAGNATTTTVRTTTTANATATTTTTVDPKKLCCDKPNAECLACLARITVAEYCSRFKVTPGCNTQPNPGSLEQTEELEDDETGLDATCRRARRGVSVEAFSDDVRQAVVRSPRALADLECRPCSAVPWLHLPG
eukprot:CAMPEP_0176202016 /NCGR_PEP_ID=MMETSP0121_2-20121125/9860_1 /TAXON_ID=160619 /ORGANISM="Kryptoperidinium foliaceum, Strain CCMP 1326" /LENGTH=306 /DNA_ID=CAMNT_0017540903 /DNA_START=55 /DNA_END=973 /DNA_ORIENTATION=+